MLENFKVHNLIHNTKTLARRHANRSARKDRQHSKKLYVVDNLLQLQSFKQKGYP